MESRRTLYPYKVCYRNNIFRKNMCTPENSLSSARRKVKLLKKQNKISEHNSKIINGKPFTIYKNIKIKKR